MNENLNFRTQINNLSFQIEYHKFILQYRTESIAFTHKKLELVFKNIDSKGYLISHEVRDAFSPVLYI